MKNTLITDGNRGLSHGFVQHLLDWGDRVWVSWFDRATSLIKLTSNVCNPIKSDAKQPLPEAEISKLPDEINLRINNAHIHGCNCQYDF